VEDTKAAPRALGRYVLHEAIATGGMATVHVGRMTGAAGFSTTIAIKRLHPQLAGDPQFAAMFLDEARVASRVRHPNVVPTLDVVCEGGELFLVLEYVHGESLGSLLRLTRAHGGEPSPRIVCGVMVGVLRGLHAAHEATSERGEPLGIVHRDVSPQNILVGADGVPRVLDFGVAKAMGRLQTTRGGQLKGKLGYMAPEQVLSRRVGRTTDVFAAAIVLWEALSGRSLFPGETDAAVVHQVLHMPIERLPNDPRFGHDLVAIVARGLEREPDRRYASALEMADALERASGPVSPREIGAWVEATARDVLARRAALVARVEARSIDDPEGAGEAPSLSSSSTPTGAPGATPPLASQIGEPASQVSVSVAQAPTQPTARTWRAAAVVAIALGATAAGAIALRSGARPPATPEASADPGSTTVAPTGSAEASPATVAASDPAGAASAAQPEPAEPATSATAPLARRAHEPVRPPPARSSPATAPPPSVRPFYGRK